MPDEPYRSHEAVASVAKPSFSLRMYAGDLAVWEERSGSCLSPYLERCYARPPLVVGPDRPALGITGSGETKGALR